MPKPRAGFGMTVVGRAARVGNEYPCGLIVMVKLLALQLTRTDYLTEIPTRHTSWEWTWRFV
jgi:hypothetical protein